MILDQSQTNYSEFWGSLYGTRRFAQSFTTGAGVISISQNRIWVQRVGTDFTITCDVYLSDTGANDNKPTGNSLGSKELTGIPTTANGEEITFTFATPISCSAATKYVLVFKYPDGTFPDHVIKFYSAPEDSAYAGGTVVYSADAGVNWTVFATYDFYFKTYYEIIYVNKIVSLKWDIISYLKRITILKWDINNFLTKEITIKWNINNFLKRVAIIKWDVFEYLKKIITLIWRIDVPKGQVKHSATNITNQTKHSITPKNQSKS